MTNLPESYQTVKIDVDGFKLTMQEREVCLLMTTRSTTKLTVNDIAEKYGISRERVYQITKSRDYKRFQQYLLDEIFGEMVSKAIQELDNMLETTTSPSIKLKVIQTILQASGKVENKHNVVVEAKQQESQEERERRIIEMEKELLGD